MNEMNDPYEYKMSSRGIIPRGHIDDNTLNEAMILLMNTILRDSKIASFVISFSPNCDIFDLPFINQDLGHNMDTIWRTTIWCMSCYQQNGTSS
jgi:hypothetical protein